MPRMTDCAESNRGTIEDGMGALAGAQLRLSLVQIRVRQAVERGGMGDLLGPALEEITVIGSALLLAQQSLASVWTKGDWERDN